MDLTFPKVRPLEMIPIKKGRSELILIRDPEGIMDGSLVVSKDVAYLLALMDGTRSLREIQVEYMRAFGELIYSEKLDEIIKSLDEHYLLQNERYQSLLMRLKEEYEAQTVRKPYLAGKSYPEGRMDLIRFLDELFSKTKRQRTFSGSIRGVLSPHIDYSRGEEVYSDLYSSIRSMSARLIVVFGTLHKAQGKLWNISLKDFETPIDIVRVPSKLRELILEDPVLRYYVYEWPHRTEHSIELQLPLLQFTLQEEFEILPILTGSMQEYIEGEKGLEDQEIESLINSLKACLDRFGEPYAVVAGADLAHIGLQFGDIHPLDTYTLMESKAKDERLLSAVCQCDARSFFELIREERDRRRICGLAPIYFLLRLVENSKGELISYKQWTDGSSSVSFAGVVFTD